MLKIEHRRTTNLPADKIWEEMRHFDRVLNWIPKGAESSITITGEGVGMIRDIKLATMGYVQHELLTFDDKQRTFSYRLTGGKPLGMQNYQVTAKVTPLDDDQCEIHWLGEMTAEVGVEEAEIGGALETALGNMTIGIIAVVQNAAPAFVLQPRVDT